MLAHARISVLIRTIGRATLARSVACAIAQTCMPCEIVIVNAACAALPDLPEAPGVKLRVIGDRRRNRPEAANAAIDAARGDWLVFLDDDDAYEAGHLASLRDRLERAPGARVAYSATRVMDPQGRPCGVLAAEFDRMRLFAGNYIQMGAALFDAGLVRAGCRFDESLECFQDWDFFIQLAQRTYFAFSPQATNRWFAFDGGSGAGAGANERPAATQRFHDRVVARWSRHAASLESKVRQHRECGARAMAFGDATEANHHFAAARRLVSGPPEGEPASPLEPGALA